MSPTFIPSIFLRGVIQINATPENLRERAKAAEIAGDENLANSLNAEADELENATPATDTGEVPQ